MCSSGSWTDDYSGVVGYESTEITCDSADNDCDGSVDENLTATYYQDNDNDTYGNPSVSQNACSSPNGYVTNNTDCNDSDASVYPGAPEVCDNKDNDCDGNIDSLSIYAENFSIGADGWQASDKLGPLQSDDSQNFWDSQAQTLNLSQGVNARSAVHAIDYDGGSFTFKYDMYVDQLQAGVPLTFGLFSDPNHPGDSQFDHSFVYVSYSVDQSGPFISVERYSGRIPRGDFQDEALVQNLLDNEVLHTTELSPEYVFFSNEFEDGNQFRTRLNELGITDSESILNLWIGARFERVFIEEFQPENIEHSWWHHEISYNEETQQVRVVISRGQGGSEEVVVDITEDVPNGFSEEMIFLILSSQADSSSVADSTGYLDNVNIQQVCQAAEDPPLDDDDKDGEDWYECSVSSGNGPFTGSAALNLLIVLLPLGIIAFRRRYYRGFPGNPEK